MEKKEETKAAETATQETAAEATKKTEKKEKSEKETKQPAEKTSAPSALESVGKAAIKEHGYDKVFVTADGVAFKLESDAKSHAANLSNRSILTVKK